MSDTSPGGKSRVQTPTPPPTQRSFFSTTSVNEFFDQLQLVLTEQHAQTRALVTIVAPTAVAQEDTVD